MTALDFTTNYLGLELKNPLVASASPLSKKVESVRRLADAGVAAVVMYSLFEEQITHESQELNIYYLPTDIDLSGADLEETYVTLVKDLRAKVKLPIAVKLSPYFTSIPNVAKRLVEAGAHGLVLFNRFYQPDFDLDELKVVPDLDLSTSHELRLPLRWIAILYGRIAADFALTSGVHTARDVLKAMMAGASVAMMTST